MYPRSGRQRLAVLLFVSAFLLSCAPGRVVRHTTSPRDFHTINEESPFLKAHMLDGSVYVLADWSASADGKSVSGQGEHLDLNRQQIASGVLEVSIEEVALFETNVLSESSGTAGMAVITGISVAVTAACMANPKACFGSCPTFFGETDSGWALLAEGFSASVAPSLEAIDVDALIRWRPEGNTIELKMTNEALETHVVRHVDLLAVPLEEGESAALSSEGDFRKIREWVEPLRATAAEGDCLAELRDIDDLERSSLADSTDLAAVETIDLEFELPEAGEWGVMLGMRQSLMTTFLFYQGLAYLGSSAGQWLARLESMDATKRSELGTLWSELGGVRVQVERAGSFVEVGEVNETGPLAIDYDVVPLPELEAGLAKIRLELTRGLWRIDSVALVRLGERVEPQRLRPAEVHRSGRRDPVAHELLLDPESSLVTLPGDEYLLSYELPDGSGSWELFLESRGYYLEWMRDEWIEDENPALAAKMLLMPRQTLRDLAPAYKAIESGMEAMFWESRYAKP